MCTVCASTYNNYFVTLSTINSKMNLFVYQLGEVHTIFLVIFNVNNCLLLVTFYCVGFIQIFNF